MDNVNAFLLAYSVILTFSVVFVAIHVIYKDRYYRSKFVRNLIHCDNILNQHKLTCIDTDRIHHKQTKRLSQALDNLIKKCNEEDLKENYTKYLDEKYNENRKLQEDQENININVDNGTGLTKVVDSNYIGDYIDEWCPICKEQLLGNKAKHKWCSNSNCEYGLNTTTET